MRRLAALLQGSRGVRARLQQALSRLPDDDSRTAISLAVPLLGTVCWTYGAVRLLCSTPWTGRVRWPGLVATSVEWMVVAAVAHLIAVWLNSRLFRQVVDAPPLALAALLWKAVVWLPLLVLLEKESSPWVMAVPLAVAASAVPAFQGWVGAVPRTDAGPLGSLRRPPDRRSFLVHLVPALLCSAAWHGSVAAFLSGRELLAGCLLTAGAVLPLSERQLGRESSATSSVTLRDLPRWTAVVSLLMMAALLPYLRPGGTAAFAGKVLDARALKGAPPLRPGPKRGAQAMPQGSYTGVILLAPAKKSHTTVVAPVEPNDPGAQARQPARVIPFDGAYWYFKAPDTRPREDAPTVHGSPTEHLVRSTDARPLVMEAHQRLTPPINADGCRTLTVTVLNAEGRPGAIVAEVRLHVAGPRGDTVRSLGEQPLTTSRDGNTGLARYPAEETLRFAMQRAGRATAVDEITVAVKWTSGPAQTGAHIAVESFELVR